MQEQLDEIPNEGAVHEKYAAYNLANKKVAILCNHQRTVSTTHETMMQKQEEKIKGLRYQKLRLKRMILSLEPTRKKKNPAFFKPDPEIDDEEWIKEHQFSLVEQEKERITKKFEKDNEKLQENGEKVLKDKELKERLQVIKDMEAEFKTENKTGKIEPKRGATVEKLEAQIQKMEERIKKQETEAQVREDNKTVALGTSKINYIDPRLTVMFCKKYGVPIEKIFAKTLRDKFKWAIESADGDWKF
jgi:DNA topoisomerase-1